MISKNQARKAGQCVANGDLAPHNVRVLEEYRSSFDSFLVRTTEAVNRSLSQGADRFLVTGRPKRTSSIIRKLIKMGPQTNVSNMADLVGVRILVYDMCAQNRVATVLNRELGGRLKEIDYRTRERGYRSVHLIYRDEGKSIEVQVRSLAQHLWAVESESFGQTVKDGGGSSEVRRYLDDELGRACKAADEGVRVDVQGGDLYRNRSPIGRFLPNMQSLFSKATQGFSRPRPDTTYIVVFDSMLYHLTRIDPFRDERDRAIGEYNRLCGRLNQERYDVVVLNSRTPQAISVTHPNFFPNVRFGRFDENLPIFGT